MLLDLYVQDGRLALNIASGRGSVGVATALADRMQQLRVRTDSLHDVVDDVEGDPPVGEQEERESRSTVRVRGLGSNSTDTARYHHNWIPSGKSFSRVHP